MPKLDLNTIPEIKGSSYPAPFDTETANRVRQRLGEAAGLTQFGINLLRLPSGAWSSQRHWHASQDEFVYVISGEVVLITEKGEEVLRAGDCVAFPKNVPDGHQLVNRSGAVACCLEIGARTSDERIVYSDIDMVLNTKVGFTRKDGSSFS